MPSAPPRPARVVPVALGAVADLPAVRAAAVEEPAVPGWTGVRLSGITHDSRAVRPGDLYAALPGERTHGAAFAAQAADAGAVAILTDPAGDPGTDLPVLRLADPRGVLGQVAAAVYADPSRRLALYGVTGTNGKTTTAYLLEAGLRAAGHTTGLVGTIETRVAGETFPSVRTTPEATDLQALLAVMVERGVTACAMEVSSHALVLGRVDGCHFTAAGFTNLGRDHLDFHGDVESYFLAKAGLFVAARTPLAVLDVTDPYGARLAAEVRDLRVVEVGPDLAVDVAMLGAYNRRNAALALSMLVETGVDPVAARRGIAELPGVPGRMERVAVGQPFLALVDYAHTPDAVSALLEALRPLTGGRLIVVLGCGGDRDRGKRPVMGRLAASLADRAVFTDDNPRSEPGEQIVAEMLAGVPAERRSVVTVVRDRGEAIDLAVAQAEPGDVVVVAGKGHETGQDSGGHVVPFDDREALRSALLRARAVADR